MNKTELHEESHEMIAKAFKFMQRLKQGVINSEKDNKQKGKKGKPFEKKVKSVLTRPSLLGMG
mgnify:CR=1 FL=1